MEGRFVESCTRRVPDGASHRGTTASAVHRLKPLDGALHETERLHPVVFLMLRGATADLERAGFRISARRARHRVGVHWAWGPCPLRLDDGSLSPTANLVTTEVAVEHTGIPEQARAVHENFPVALSVLPDNVRRELNAVYAYVRLVDDLGDEADGDRVELLGAARAELDLVYGGTPISPVFRSLQPVVHAHRIPREPFDRLIDANLVDQRTTRYRSTAELLDHCVLSANPIGRIVLHVFDAATAERAALSDSVCTALQILEHVQDVAEDFPHGRVYLPQEDMVHFGVTEEHLARSRTSPELRALVEHQVERARSMLDRGSSLVGELSGWARLAVAGYVAGGSATAKALRRARFDVLARRIRPGKSAISAELAELILRRGAK